ncbi:hypothetical protein FOPG_13304 [Fusarium oxysporum f. sp. conglutinans race 2 54008]|uniref:Uncharacterized protein n=2 Tax=Fusarium oxysporum TaxID=5507 RepID=X0HGT3_FUSOX|nr:hypothetical protein FOVG_17338 [Fusarium oxysporum f. sp. pisi HDV247]EXL70935.1 hypothetical protein FOPG_13304 [Fusarium oxysporum f. sp. conglutinans race 2 54008]
MADPVGGNIARALRRSDGHIMESALPCIEERTVERQEADNIRLEPTLLFAVIKPGKNLGLFVPV